MNIFRPMAEVLESPKASGDITELWDKVDMAKLAKGKGTPLVLVFEEIIKKKFGDLKSALEAHYSNFEIAYSFKTNSVPGICKVFKSLGAKAEVVSGYEYFLAKRLGYKGSEIIFNGPCKGKGELYRAMKEGSIINLDNFEEVEEYLSLAAKASKEMSVGVRVNSNNWPSHFGFNIENGEVEMVINKIRQNKNVNLGGLHMHIGYNIDEARVYEKEARVLCRLLRDISKKFGIEIGFIDIGGGFPGGSRPFDKEAWRPLAIEKYIGVISEAIKNELPGGNVKLILEPGRYLVDEGVILVAQVVSTKITGKRQEVKVDTTIDQLPLVTYREQEVYPFRNRGSGKSAEYVTTIFGISCRENDVLARDLSLWRLKKGDFIVFLNVGAYNISWQNQFSFPRPPILMLARDDKVKTLRKRECYDDLINLDKI